MEPVILYTFFSASAARKASELVTGDDIFAMPLPMDLWFSIHRWMGHLRPDLFLCASYDIWPVCLAAMRKYRVKTVLFSALLRKQSGRKNFITRRFFGEIYRRIDLIDCVDISTKRRYIEITSRSEDQIAVSGDARVDYIHQAIQRQAAPEKSFIKMDPKWVRLRRWCGYSGNTGNETGSWNGFVLAVASVYEKSDRILIPALRQALDLWPSFRCVYVPHHTDRRRIDGLCRRLDRDGVKYIVFSRVEGEMDRDIRCVVIDEVGLLIRIYGLCDAAFVGGSFHRKIHNVYEPAYWGIPIFFGPRYHNAPEAERLLQKGGADVVESAQQVLFFLRALCKDTGLRLRMGRICREDFENQRGASMRAAERLIRQFGFGPGEKGPKI